MSTAIVPPAFPVEPLTCIMIQRFPDPELLGFFDPRAILLYDAVDMEG
jgi:hypothetical protein